MKKKFSFAIVLFVAGIVVAGAISVSAVKQAYRSRKIENEVERLRQQAQAIGSENDTIRRQIEYYGTPEFVERVSKDKMNLQKPDENVVVVSRTAAAPGGAVTENEKRSEVSRTDQDGPNHVKWWNFFFKYD